MTQVHSDQPQCDLGELRGSPETCPSQGWRKVIAKVWSPAAGCCSASPVASCHGGILGQAGLTASREADPGGVP